MSEVLFLSHRIPYPPNKGDKIRSWQLLKALAQRHAVRLGSFVDRAEDWQYVPVLREHCAETYFAALQPVSSRLRGLVRALRGASITAGAYQHTGMARWVMATLSSRPVRSVFVFSSAVAQYAELPGVSYPRRIIDLCDVDSDKWRQFSRQSSGVMRCIYALEQRRLASAEQRWIANFDSTLVVSEAERRLLPETAAASAKVVTVGNGVDADFFDPAVTFAPVYAPQELPIVFTGAMDYLPNVDGVEWFANEIFPEVRRRCERAMFVVVGAHPASRVRALANRPGIRITGAVEDVRPFVSQAACIVVCLRIARGVQNKLLEAMAMARPIVATSMSTQGLAEYGALSGVEVADAPAEFAARVVRHLRAPASARHNAAAREFVIQRFGWERTIRRVLELVEGEAA